MKKILGIACLALVACSDHAIPESVVSLTQALSGPVAAYAFDEGTGTTAADASGNANTGTLVSAAWTTTAKFGKALHFDGSSARVQVADANALDLTNGMTLEAWVRPASTSGWRCVVLKEANPSLAYGLYASGLGPTLPSGWVHVGTDVSVSAAGALALNTWTHLATTYDGATQKIYVNGTQAGTRNQTGSTITSNGPLGIGGNALWGEYFSGEIDEVRVYARALSASEIAIDMATPIGSGGTGGTGGAGAGGVGTGGMASGAGGAGAGQTGAGSSQGGAGQAGAAGSSSGAAGGGAAGQSGSAGAGQGGVGGSAAGTGGTGNTGNTGGAVDFTLDGAHPLQRIDGFGASINSLSWHGGEAIPALDLLLNAGAKLIRVSFDLLSALEPTNDNADPNTFNWTAYRAAFTTPDAEELWSTIGYLNAHGIDDPILVFFGPAPNWMGGGTLSSSAADEFAEMVSALLYYARFERHLSIGAVSPLNEPDNDGIEGPQASASAYAAIMHKLMQRLEALDLGRTQIIGPETAFVDQGVQTYAPAMQADPLLMAHLRAFAIHTYAAYFGTASQLQKPFWASELSLWDDAVSAVLFGGASGVMIWDGYDSVYHHAELAGRGSSPPNDVGNGPALLAYDSSTHVYTPRPIYYDFEQLAAFVGEGSVRLTLNQNWQMECLGFHHPTDGRVTLYCHNRTSNTYQIHGALAGLPNILTFQQYVTTGSQQFARLSDVPVTNGRFTATVQPGSFTLTGVP